MTSLLASAGPWMEAMRQPASDPRVIGAVLRPIARAITRLTRWYERALKRNQVEPGTAHGTFPADGWLPIASCRAFLLASALQTAWRRANRRTRKHELAGETPSAAALVIRINF
jgi:hypothetical protein